MATISATSCARTGTVSAWWVVPRSDTEALQQLATLFDLDEVAVHDVTADDRRIVYRELDGVSLLTTRTARLVEVESQPSLELRTVALLVSDRVLVVVADDQAGAEVAGALTGPHPRVRHIGAEQAAQLVLHHIVRGHAEVVGAIEERADDLAESMFDEQVLSRAGKQQIFSLRRAVSELRRISEPMREQLQSLADDATGPDSRIGSGKDKHGRTRQWQLVLGHQDRVADSVDALADSLGTLFDTSLSLDDERMNATMKKLTGWAAIIAAPTLVSGFVGMNVPFWLNGTRTGFWVYLIVMVVAVVVLFTVMKRKNWI